MSPRVLCVDTDALINLLGLGCFDKALRCLGFARQECLRLRAAKYQIARSKGLDERWPFFNREEAQAVLADLQVAAESPSRDLLGPLNINGIDEGEALFLALAAVNPEYLFLSGDRRMLEGLHAATAPEVIAIREAVRGRVIMFTQVVAEIAKRYSLGVIEKAFRQSLGRHSGLRILFGTTKPTSSLHFWSAYESERREYARICGADWLYPVGSPPPREGGATGDFTPFDR